jgi:translocation and assembly module TamB
MPAGVTIDTLEGRLAGPLQIRGLELSNDTFQLEIDKIQLQWQPLQLVHRVLDIDSLAAEGVRYRQLDVVPPQPKEKSAPITLPEEIVLPGDMEVRLGEVSLRDFAFRSQPENTPFVIASALLRATVNKQGLNISSLKIESPLFAVQGKTHLATHGDYAIQGELDWQVPVPDYPTLHGHTLLGGSLREMTITQSIAKPYDVQGTVLLRNPVENLAFEIALHIHPLKLQAINKDLPPMTAQLTVKAQGNPDDMTFNLSGWAEDAKLGRADTTLAGGFTSNTLTLDTLKVSVAEQAARVTVKGQIIVADTPDFDLTIDWQQLQWPLQQPTIKSPKGHIVVDGKIDAYTLGIQADVAVPEKTDAQILLEGQGSREALTLSRIDITSLEGKIEGKAGLSWQPELKGDVDLVGQGLNPGVILHDWPGKLDFSLQAQGGMSDDLPRLQLPRLSLQGQLRGYAVALDAAGSYAENLATLQRLALSSGSTKLDLSGTMSDMLDVRWQVHSKDLGTLLPEAKGRMTGKGTLAGPLKSPRVVAALDADGLVYRDTRLQSLHLDADVDVAGKAESKVSLGLTEGNAAGVELHKIVLNGRGVPGAHTLTLAADTSSGQADIALQGDLQNPGQPDMTWNFTLTQANLKYPGLDGWALQKPSSGQISAGQAMLSESCWQTGEALLCLTGRQTTEKIQADFTLTDLPFSYVSSYLPPDIDVQGNLNAKGTLRQSAKNAPFVAVDLKTSPVRLLARESHEDEQKDALIIAFLPVDMSLQMDQGGLQADMALPLSQTDSITLQAAILPGQTSLMERPLNGRLTTEIENLDFIADLLPEVQSLAGRLTGTMAIAGSPASPVLQGRLALVEGAAELEGPGLYLQDIQVELTGEGESGIRLTAHAVSEEGELDVDGTADLRDKATIADITVKGENFRVLNTLEAQVDISPNLAIALRENRLDVGGELVIPTAQITVKTIPESAVKVSGDQVIIRSEEQEKEDPVTGRRIYAQVRTVLGDNVRFNGFGLKARIEGDILAIEKPGEPTTASGELKIVDGEYRAYGQGLVIEKGRVLFSGGPIGQPGLDVRAVRRPEENITVGVQVRGNLRQPDFTLFSDPSMTQGNQLSYLVLGRPLRGTSDNEGSALGRAALALGLRGGNTVAEKIGGSLGLDQFGIDSGEAGSGTNPKNASFVIGKYLSPKLYVSYGLGLFHPISTLRLQYTISDHWKFVTESSTKASGGDVIYVIETGE